MSARDNWGNRLYRGEVSYDIVGRQKLWYMISGIVIVIAIAALALFGLKLGLEFKGGSQFSVKAPNGTTQQATQAVTPYLPASDTPIVQKIGNETIRVQTRALPQDTSQQVQTALAKTFGVKTTDVNTQLIGPSWGKQISDRALQALIVFLVLVVLFLSVMFEWKLAVAAIAALAHDIVITVGLYALLQFEVTPGTVIGFLTILGYSLYDTVVVFDKVRENTRALQGGSRMTYSEAANLAVNQTLVRSINTSVIALLPIAGLLFIGAGVLGAGTLKDLALVLFIGVAAGTYSSIFIATPLAADLKEREPAMRALRRRVEARRVTPNRQPVTVGAGTSGDGGSPEPDLPVGDEAGEEDTPSRRATAPPASRSGGSRRPQSRRSPGAKGRPSGKRKR